MNEWGLANAKCLLKNASVSEIVIGHYGVINDTDGGTISWQYLSVKKHEQYYIVLDQIQSTSSDHEWTLLFILILNKYTVSVLGQKHFWTKLLTPSTVQYCTVQ